MGGIPVNRGEPDLQAIKAVMNVLKDEKKQLVIFPEGTRNRANDDSITPLKNGTARFAIKAKRRILPVMYYRKLRPFKRNYMYIGEPIDLSEFYNDKPTEENKTKATQYVYEKMLETRRLCNEAVEEILAKKEAKKNKRKCKK
ncbi:MAG: 1-acyl-sn-glycerol-3-phosphate acyltransferase [Clostridia bacterium]|nr:1-acyl-sn-glycerol-3-phosphate acyltransferase [Clostridia bacterium]